MGGWMGGHLVIIGLVSVQLQLKLDFQLELSLAKYFFVNDCFVIKEIIRPIF